MDGQSSQPRPAPSWLNRDGPWLAVLLLIVVVLRCWLVVNTEVTARDSIGFIRYALSFDHLSWSDALKQHQHPGYPAVVWLVSKPMRSVFGTTPEVMRVSAQIVSLAAALLLAVMMFRLGRLLWDRYIGFFAALLFQCFPISGHHLSDGISDGLFLLLAISALFTLIRARETGAIWRYALGGAFIGLAYLTRPEGLLVLPAAWLFLLGLQLTKDQKLPWRQVGVRLTALTLSCALAGAPYYLATGTITRKPSAWHTIEKIAAAKAPDQAPDAGGPLFASLFAANFAPSADLQEQFQHTLRALLFELGQALNYIGGIFAVWALLFCRKLLTRHIGFYLLATYFSIHAAILVKLGLKVSYVSDRHVMALVALACYLCVIGVAHMCLPWTWWVKAGATAAPGYLFPRVVQTAAAGWLLLALGICTGKTVTRLHANRLGNHQAGLWLAQQIQTGDIIEDDHSWSHFYAGLLFTEFDPPKLPSGLVPNHYFVMTRSKEDGVREKRETQEEALKKSNARMVYHWPTAGGPAKARIVVYARPRNYDSHPWTKAESPGVYQPVSRQK
jgi:hypothetical protein